MPQTQGGLLPSHGAFAADLVSSLDWLAGQATVAGSPWFGGVDGSRRGVMGHSMGGGCSLLAAQSDASIRCAVPWAAANTNARLADVPRLKARNAEQLAKTAALILSEGEAATLLKTYPNLTTISKAELRNKRPFAYPLPQGDPVWTIFVNNWVALKKSEGFFDALEAKWLGR